ncbi:MAG: carboxylate--amine ligase [Verrucomicrobiae bacterium]|nr:carboxylate--amine ligase [Verrucomicrobiae bacterium]
MSLVLLFGLVRLSGAPIGGWLLPVLVAVVLVGLRHVCRRPWCEMIRRWGPRFGRWRRWEFWPAWLFYLPVVARYAQLALRYRGITLPSAANPGIATGGLVGESKFATLRELSRTSPEFTAEAWLLPAFPDERNAGNRMALRLEMLRSLCARNAISFPFILKPDVGQRGAGVKLIRGFAGAEDYLSRTDAALVVQRYAPGPLELGVFYYRFPQEPHGRIFSVTEKVFPSLTGDGHQTIEELIHADPRARFVAERYLTRFATRRDDVLAKGEALRLVEAGNHAQGCIFRDGAHLLTPGLADRLDSISRGVPGFFIGRYDLRYASETDLSAGRNFQIIELNGAAAEATSIYDSRSPLHGAYRTLFQQWELVFAIGAANRDRGARSNTVMELWRAWRDTTRLTASYPLAD